MNPHTPHPSLTVYDDFHPLPHELRSSLLSSDFTDQVGLDGMVYTNISFHEDPALYSSLESRVGPIKPILTFWRLDLEGELPNTHVHADTICADYAALLYINPPEQCKGGTAFYTHLATNRIAMPQPEEVEDYQAFCQQIDQDFQQPEKWKQSGYASMRFNRLIIYPTTIFHSRFPHEAFGKDRYDGRLVWICFFNRTQ